MKRRRLHLQLLLLTGLVAGLSAASAFGGGTTLPTTTLVPVVPTGDVATQSTPFIAWIKDLAPDNYVEQEYLVSGAANIYQYTNDAAQSPDVEVMTADEPYTTRILVRRPTSPGKFSGTVFVEVLNATAGWDGDPIWQATHEYMIREGAIWVGVTTKPNTVNFLKSSWGNSPWPTRNASRYATLAMPKFGQVWDMMSQVGALLKTPGAAGNPLAGFDVKRLVMVGYSQSAAYETTYANSIHASMPGGSPVYDGYYIAAGGSRAKDVTGPAPVGTRESLPLGDARNLTKVGVPLIRFQTQFEVVNSGAYLVRQSEAVDPLLRFYEGAGLTHVDTYLDLIGGQALVRDLGLPPSFCPSPALPINPIRNGYVQAALLEMLDNWIAKGTTPAASRYLELTATNTLARDADGNVIGGIRPPDIQVPLGTTIETNTGPGFCGLFGAFAPFSNARLAQLYPNHGKYVSQYTKAVQENVKDAFLLPEDAKAQRTAAAQSSIGK
jgi:hypothetical protein